MNSQRRFISRALICQLFILCVFAASAWGQDPAGAYNIGFPENGVFSGNGFSSVQLNNGNLHIELPLFSVKGRAGLSVAYKYVYDSSGLFILHQTCNPRYDYCTYSVVPGRLSGSGWRMVGPASYWAKPTLQSVLCPHASWDVAYSYSLIEPDGTTHGMLPNPMGACGYWAPIGSTLHATDGSGWSLNVSPTGTSVDLSNNVLSPNIEVQDTNGNQLILESDGVTVTDTLGRQFPIGLTSTSIPYVDSSGNTQTIQVTSQNVSIQTHLCGSQSPCTEYVATVSEPATITLPGNNLKYTIAYSSSPSYGQPISITLPTGGQLSYAWTNGSHSPITSRTETAGGQAYTWSYSGTYGQTVTDPAGNQQVPTCMLVYTTGAPNPGDTPLCYITQMQYYQGTASPANLLKTVTTGYIQVGGISTGGNGNPYYLLGDYLPNSETTTWNQTNLVTQTQTDYDSVASYWGAMLVNNPSEKREYAFGTGSPGALVRRTHYTYLHNSIGTYNTLNMLDRVTSKVVYDGSGNIKAQTGYSYDTAPVTSTSGTPAPNHDYTNFGSGYTTRGNLTQTSQGLLVGSTWTWLNTTNTYDDLGNKLSTTDPKLNTTNFSFADNWGTDTNCTLGSNTFAYLTKTTDTLSHQTQHTYFRCTGLVSSTKDQNDINNSGPGTTFTYDFLDRPLTISYPDGGQTTSSYVDVAPLSITQNKLVTSGLNIQRTSVFDGLGRLQEGQLNDPDCTVGSKLVKVDHAYGFNSGYGAYTQVSTPYCDTPNSVYGLLTTTQKDALDRVTSLTQTDGSTITTTYSGTTAGLTSTVTDEAGRKRTSQTDALGRMTAVWEDPSGLNYETDYAYDTLDSLISATQKGTGGARTRTFTYDTLSRLKCAANPEVTSSVNTPASCPASDTGTYTAGTIGYTYDGDSNMVTKTAPAPNQTGTSSTAVTTYSYDNVNRLTQKTYTGGATTPTVQYAYDAGSLSGCGTSPPTLSPADKNPIYYRTAMCDGSGATSWSHDPLGRVLTEQRIINGTSAINYAVNYYYYKDGELNTLTYPSSGRVVTYTANGSGGFSAGRPGSAADTANNISYVASAAYAPQGALASLTNGGSILGAFSYNSRLQPLQMFYGTNTPPVLTGSTCPSTVGNILHRVYNFNVGAGDNGNAISIANCRDTNRTQSFTYDSLNRIATAATQGTTCTDCWGQMFGHMSGSTFVPGIDAWGNLFQITATQGSPTTLSQSMTGNNQFLGMTYDASGNLMNDGGGHTYTFDDENRLTTTAGYTYVYDGDGKRVVKCGGTYPACTSGTLYWTGTGSDTLSESSVGGSITEEYVFFNGGRIARRDNSGGAVHYYFADHLGSADVITDNLGNVRKESDYYPYGGEVVVSGSDINNYKFTGKERDSESELDNFGARYDASSLGRFMTPDPLYIEARRLADPQRLNLYAYARNNPVTLSDPKGLDVTLKCASKDTCVKAVQDFNSRTGAQFKVELGKDGKLQVVKGSVAKGIGGAEGKLLGAINDSSNHATINVSGNTGQSEFGTHDSKGVNSVDLGNLSKLDARGNAGGLNSGDALAHEAMDAYYSLSMGEAAADQAAAGLYPGLLPPTGNQNTWGQAGTVWTGSTFSQAISNGSGTERVSIQFITPIPAVDLFGKSASARNTAHDAGSRVTEVTFVPPKQQ